MQFGTEPSFVVEQGGARVLNFDLKEGVPAVLGRSPQANVQIGDPGLSRLHCRLELTPQGVLITDLGSSNGTYVNGERIHQLLLKPGDVIAVGTTTIRLADPMASFSSTVQLSANQELTPQTECTQCGNLFPVSDLGESEMNFGQTGFVCPSCRGGGPGQSAIPGYQIQGKLGEGAMGTVYKATRTSDQIPCVIKVMKGTGDISQVKYFIREAKSISALLHPNIIQIYEFGDVNGKPFMAMEYVDGGTLGDRLKTVGPLTVKQVIGIGGQMAKALRCAAEKNIVHRDIKPENIFLTREGQAKLGDFGLAKDITQSGQSGLTRPGEGRGTPLYMPPEQLDNAINADVRSDIYALGATLYHAVVGSPPFTGKSLRVIIRKIIHEEPAPPSEAVQTVPRELDEALLKMLHKDPEDRYQTPGEVLQVLGRLWSQVQ